MPWLGQKFQDSQEGVPGFELGIPEESYVGLVVGVLLAMGFPLILLLPVYASVHNVSHYNVDNIM